MWGWHSTARFKDTESRKTATQVKKELQELVKEYTEKYGENGLIGELIELIDSI